MKTKILTLAIAILGFTTASFAQVAQNSSSTTAFATGTIITPINITGSNLIFGTIVTSNMESGSLTISADGSNTTDKVVLYTGSGAVNPQASVFSVTGDAGNTFTINVSGLPTVVTHTSDASATMALSNWVSNNSSLNTSLGSAGTSASGTGTLSATGADSFNIGAKLTVGQSQKAGEYKSSAFTVTVNYN